MHAYRCINLVWVTKLQPFWKQLLMRITDFSLYKYQCLFVISVVAPILLLVLGVLALLVPGSGLC